MTLDVFDFQHREEDYNRLRKKLEECGYDHLPISFNFNDHIALAKCETKKELCQLYDDICDSIHRVYRTNLAINHSNFRSV